MALDIPIFEDGYTLKVIREKSLNPTIEAVKALDLKVKGLQDVVVLTMTQPDVNVADKKITFTMGGAGGTPHELDLGPMFDDYKHGIDVRGDIEGPFTNVQKIKFKNARITQNGDELTIEAKTLTGQVGAETVKGVAMLRITGNTDGSSLDSNGTMTLNMPSNSIKAEVNGSYYEKVDKVRVSDVTNSSTIIGDTLTIKIPDPLKGSIQGGGDFDLKSIEFRGNTGTSSEVGGKFTIDLPSQEVDTDESGSYEVYHKIAIKGNKGATKVVNQVLELDLPYGGGGGGSSDLKVGMKGFSAIPDVGEIWFEGSDVKVDTTRASTKVLVTPKGFPVEKEGDATGAKYVKQIKLTGDVEHSTVSDTGLLELNIPIHQGITVSDGKTVVTAAEGLSFPNATVTTDSSSSTPQAVITFDGTQGSMSGKSATLKELVVKGNLGTSTFDSGVMTLDLPAGGGGTGGADITGVVGSTAAKIERIEVAGEVTNSSVTESTKTLKIDIPRKVAIKGGADIYSDIDTVEVANSIVELDDTGGSRKAFIVPQIPFMFYGWFRDIDSLNLAIPQGGRIPTKSCGYVMDPVTHQNTLMMWMPGAGGVNDWAPIPVTGSITLMEKGAPNNKVLSIDSNPMVQVNNQGLMTITDTTVPEVICETLSSDGTTPIKKGKFNELRFDDGAGVVEFDTGALDLKIFRAQRRFSMGDSANIEASSYADEQYEGSLWLNKTDNSWWGYNNKDAAPGTTKWSKVIHAGMSDEVKSLTDRVPESLPLVIGIDSTGDNPLWKNSGWTGVDKNVVSGILPPLAQGQTGMVIQTFRGLTASGRDGRIQIGYLGSDATMYKRYRDDDASPAKWSEWQKMSFNAGDLAEHNKDDSAHRDTHPYYKSFTFGCKYADIAAASMGDFRYVIERDKVGLIGTDGRKHRMDSDYIRVPYKGKFDINGLISFGGASNTNTNTIPSTWYVELQKCPANSAIYTTIATEDYHHGSTTLKLPPLIFKFERVDLEEDDNLRIKIRCTPGGGKTEDQYLARYKDLYIMPGRSYLTIDEDGNQTGVAIGKAMSNMYGGFVSLGGGAFAYESGTWPNDIGHVVADTLEDPVYM